MAREYRAHLALNAVSAEANHAFPDIRESELEHSRGVGADHRPPYGHMTCFLTMLIEDGRDEWRGNRKMPGTHVAGNRADRRPDARCKL